MASNELEILDPAATVEKLKNFADGRALDRRHFVAALGMAGAAAGAGFVGRSIGNNPQVVHAQSAPPISQVDILNFVLNIKYLVATFYSYGLYGMDLPASVLVGAGTVDGVPGTADSSKGVLSGTPSKVTFTGANASQITDAVNEMYYDELNHLIALQSVLGVTAVVRPSINLLGQGAEAEGSTYTLTAAQFLSMSRFFEDVSVTAYAGVATFLSGSNLTFASQIQAVEGFHAGAIRLATILQNAGGAAIPYSQADAHDVAPFDQGTAATAAAGPGASGGFFATAGPTNSTGSAPAGYAFTRTTSQILSIFYEVFGSGTVPITGTASGGFFPSGFNGGLNTI